MAFRKEILGLQLEDCCRKSFVFISMKREVAEALQCIAMPIVFASLFVGPSKGSALTTSFSIYSTDWEMLARAIAGISAIAKAQIRNIARDEQLNHLNNNSLFRRICG